MEQDKTTDTEKLNIEQFKAEVLKDYRLINESRQASLTGRKEVLTGKAKFGIFGDGKELAQIAMAKVFQKGDFRSGYYRDQTFMFATGMLSLQQFFAQLYADTNLDHEPASGGRQMNGHFSSQSIDENGKWKNLAEQYNSSADISPTAAQMPRLAGLAYASKLYRENPDLHQYSQFSNKGNEVAFGTIGNASSAEGLFWETVNAGGVLMVPMVISIWDDDYGISVPQKYQVTKENLSEILGGFRYDEEKEQGYLLYTVKGWDYTELQQVYSECLKIVREKHIPAIIHVVEVTQPQGHSTSGSHERYKSKERLEWEKEHDCISKMREWILESVIASEEELDDIEKEAIESVKAAQKAAWNDFILPIKEKITETTALINKLADNSNADAKLRQIANELGRSLDPSYQTIVKAIFDALIQSRGEVKPERDSLHQMHLELLDKNRISFNTHLYREHEDGSAMHVVEISPVYSDDSPLVDGREVMLSFFKKAFERDPKVFAIGEDVGKIGDVNQGLAGMQELYGELRVTDTGIREATIVGQGIGAAMRGLKPIAEIQYLDYLLYALQIISDDLATLTYRTVGRQQAPLIIRTRGHRFEGIWHSGSPMGTIINSFRGIYMCVPRNMTQAAGMYNTLLQSEEPALVIERLNAYRMKEKLPDNTGDYTVPLGKPEILEEGNDITIVTYGACVDIARDGMHKLAETGISCELIDVQTLLPFDVNHLIVESLKKTNRVIFMDEDVPGGASAFMMQEVLEKQGGYFYLDAEPRTLPAKAHRPAYANDGNYFSKPNAEDVFRAAYELMHESDPVKFPMFY